MPQSSARPGLFERVVCGGPCEIIGSTHWITRRPLLSCTTPLISLLFDAVPPLFANTTTTSAIARAAVMTQGRFWRLKSFLLMIENLHCMDVDGLALIVGVAVIGAAGAADI